VSVTGSLIRASALRLRLRDLASASHGGRARGQRRTGLLDSACLPPSVSCSGTTNRRPAALDLSHGPPPRQRHHINLLRTDSADTTPSTAAPAPSSTGSGVPRARCGPAAPKLLGCCSSPQLSNLLLPATAATRRCKVVRDGMMAARCSSKYRAPTLSFTFTFRPSILEVKLIYLTKASPDMFFRCFNFLFLVVRFDPCSSAGWV
jgi:hypothetical protein